jgi:hypothetical protein
MPNEETATAHALRLAREEWTAEAAAELNGIKEAAVEVWWAYDTLSTASTLGVQASAWTALHAAIGDLVTWLPGYDEDTGRLRGDEE